MFLFGGHLVHWISQRVHPLPPFGASLSLCDCDGQRSAEPHRRAQDCLPWTVVRRRRKCTSLGPATLYGLYCLSASSCTQGAAGSGWEGECGRRCAAGRRRRARWWLQGEFRKFAKYSQVPHGMHIVRSEAERGYHHNRPRRHGGAARAGGGAGRRRTYQAARCTR